MMHVRWVWKVYLWLQIRNWAWTRWESKAEINPKTTQKNKEKKKGKQNVISVDLDVPNVKKIKIVKNQVNFDVDLDLNSKSDILSEAENMEDDSITQSNLDGATSAELVQKMTEIEITILKDLANSTNVSKNHGNLDNLSIKSKKPKEIKPQPVMVLDILDVTNFTETLETKCYRNFMV